MPTLREFQAIEECERIRAQNGPVRLSGVPIVLSTILLNFVAYDLLRLLLEGALKTASTQVPQSDTLPNTYLLPVILQHAGASVHAGGTVSLIAGYSD